MFLFLTPAVGYSDTIPETVFDAVNSKFKPVLYNTKIWQNYMTNLYGKVYSNWTPPKNYGNPYSIVVQFGVIRDGSLEPESIKVVKSSGDAKLDKFAIQSVIASSPFEKLPFTLDENIQVSITFNKKTDK